MRAPTRQAGFTLIELVVTLVITAVVVSFMAMFVSAPIQGFTDQARRSRLVDAADTSLRRMARDVRRALPNSVRTTTNSGVVALEMLSTVDGGRYRRDAPGSALQILDFSAADGSFDAIAPFTQLAKPFSSTTHYLAIYNVGVPGADAYELANVITPAGTTITIDVDGATGEDRVTLNPAFRFAYGSPTQRVFLVDGPITYLCDPVAGTLMRYSGYSIASSQSARDSHGELIGAGATASLMANQVASCSFTYTAGTAERAGLVSLQIAVQAQGETISLLSQVHVDNVP
ncbi:MAG TPA: type II secretion system protein [Gammaproteobacteria bacterium]|nr:type II secretion system protein [Gammaproteobacteria bacterium]